MNILSLQFGHNATVLLMVNGEVRNVVSQERFDNIKNSHAFPVDAIKWILAENNLKPEQVDAVAISGEVIYPEHLKEKDTQSNPKKRESKVRTFFEKADYRVGSSLPMRVVNMLRAKKHEKRVKQGKKEAEKKLHELGIKKSTPLQFINHHTCHAFSPAYFFDRKKDESWLILTMDGAGDDDFASVNILEKNGELRTIAKSSWKHSIGYVYNYTTHFLGMKRLEHEYKVMGLAAYAKSDYFMPVYNKIFKNIAWLNPSNPLFFSSAFPLNRFEHHLRRHAVGERFDNVAGALQHFTEQMVLGWVKAAIEKTGIQKVMVSGGVFMNVKVNKLIQELPEVKEVKFMPSCGDESNPFGAAYYVATQHGEEIKPCGHIFLGHSFTNENVEKFIKANKLEAKYHVSKEKDISKKIAQLLADFKVVARVSGKAEFGARSLGNRAILANPSDMRSFYMVNDQIKVRDFWMPFAPSILDKYADVYLENFTGSAPYMITAFDLTPKGKVDLRAAMHQGDHTARPQVVTKERNKDYYSLISQFEKLTGIGGVMNTSFNLHGYPMASTLEQALFTFENSGLEYLALQDFIISKKEQSS